MKKILNLIALGFLAVPSIISAQLDRPVAPFGDIGNLIDNIETGVWILFGGIVVVCFVMAAVLFLTAQGEPDKIKEAKSAVVWGVAGVIVGIVAYSILGIMEIVLGA